ncbi:MAG TPA: hypothetical protein VGM90_04450 [Kofleriaceae bacterium]|jgi:hypothetical protein
MQKLVIAILLVAATASADNKHNQVGQLQGTTWTKTDKLPRAKGRPEATLGGAYVAPDGTQFLAEDRLHEG